MTPRIRHFTHFRQSTTFDYTSPKIHIWATCDPEREGDLIQCLESAFNRYPEVLRLPGYLNADPDFYSSLLESVFDMPEAIELPSAKSVVFRDVVQVYDLWARGIEIGPESQSTHLEQLVGAFSKLMMEEQLVVRLIGHLGGVRESAVHLILSALDAPLDSHKRLLESGLVNVDESNLWREVRAANDLPVQARSATTNDVRYLASILKETDLEPLRHEGWYLAGKLAQLGELISDVSLEQQLDGLLYGLRGNVYCVHCDAYFVPTLEFCPNCGGVVDQKRGQVTSSGKVPVPFPDLGLLRQGTFDTSTGVNSGPVKQLQKTLPEFKGSV